MPLPHLAVAAALRDRRVPRAEEVGAERRSRNASAARSNVGSCSRPKLTALARRSTSSPNSSNAIGGGAPKPFANAATSSSRRLRRGTRQTPRATSDRRRRPVHRAGDTSSRDRLVPGYRRRTRRCRARRCASGLGEPIGVIGDLNRRLAARAEPAVADRMLRPALRASWRAAIFTTPACPFRTTSTSASITRTVEAAAGAAQRTHARLPLRDARHELFVRHEANELVLGTAAARERGARAGDRRELDEIASIHMRGPSDGSAVRQRRGRLAVPASRAHACSKCSLPAARLRRDSRLHDAASRRPTWQTRLVMTRQTVVRCLLLPVAVHAEAHVEIDVALGDRLLLDVCRDTSRTPRWRGCAARG